MGLVSGVIVMPTINFGKWDARKKRFMVLIAMLIYLLMMSGVFLMLYTGVDTSKCVVCGYFECVPFMPGCSTSSTA